VTADGTDDQLNDVSGDYIVYTAYSGVGAWDGTIMLYRISTRELVPLSAHLTFAREPRISGGNVVWVEGPAGQTRIMWYELAWLGNSQEARPVAGPVPPADEVAIGERFIAWIQWSSGQADIWAFDLVNATRF
jgi:hypothetical protein